ncbi:hypothetical protein [uncultured Winogradskyella sp.]|uniref:hypothetical protein n=1 Tax=uncultured Winogradskyella sp. TaxID=395353 RepID=UPI003514219F
MKRIRIVYIVATAFMLSFKINAQKSQKEIELEKNKVEIFGHEEKANLQYYFYLKTKELGLNDEDEAEYYRILLHYTYDMNRLNDKDQDNSEEEIKSKLKALIKKMNSEIRTVLNEEQFKLHVKNFNDGLKAAYRKNNWKWDLD